MNSGRKIKDGIVGKPIQVFYLFIDTVYAMKGFEKRKGSPLFSEGKKS